MGRGGSLLGRGGLLLRLVNLQVRLRNRILRLRLHAPRLRHQTLRLSLLRQHLTLHIRAQPPSKFTRRGFHRRLRGLLLLLGLGQCADILLERCLALLLLRSLSPTRRGQLAPSTFASNRCGSLLMR